jgi:hypothetical protein
VLADEYGYTAPDRWHCDLTGVYTAVYDDRDDDRDAAPAAEGDSTESAAGEWVVLHSAVDGWIVMRGDDLVEAAGPDIAEDDHDAALNWAEEVLAAAGVKVGGWDPTSDPYGGPGPAYTPQAEGAAS